MENKENFIFPNQGHCLIRTNPLGENFIGKCIKCFHEELTMEQANEKCNGPLLTDNELADFIGE